MKRITTILLLVTSCSGNEISWETQEDARRQVKENVEFIARKFRTERYPDYRLIVRGDSTIGKHCAQGDGWASIDLEKGGTFIEAKCSTVSETLGCMTKEDFNQRSYANEEGSCNKNIPFPLPKVKK